MKYVVDTATSDSEKILFTKIELAMLDVYNRLKNFDLALLSEYNRRYLGEYLNNYLFYSQFYTQVLICGLRRLKKPVEESVFVDYGGGSGFFSLIAKSLGFKTVIYNDIYDVSTADAETLSKSIGFDIDLFVCGDVDILSETLSAKDISVDMMCSFCVLEHIYNVEKWFSVAGQIKGDYILVSATSANIKNPYLVHKISKLQRKAEYEGFGKKWGQKVRDTNRPFFDIRREFISTNYPQFTDDVVTNLSAATRGCNIDDITMFVTDYKNSGQIKPVIKHPTNTCDPYTGNWTEQLIDHDFLKNIALAHNFTGVDILPGRYTYSESLLSRTLKTMLNCIIKHVGAKFGLHFSPICIFVACKTSKD